MAPLTVLPNEALELASVLSGRGGSLRSLPLCYQSLAAQLGRYVDSTCIAVAVSMLDKQTLEKLIADARRFPIAALAARYDIDILDVSSLLRKAGKLDAIQPHEIRFITRNFDQMPAKAIRERLHLSTSQFSQICQKKLGLVTRKAVSAITEAEVASKTRWLVTERLRLPVDDFLPRKITNKDFVANELYNCVSFAENVKTDDPLYRYFPATAFLVCKAFPGTFRPFQFRHAKQNEYFTGKEGRQNILEAVRWVIENKMNIEPSDVPSVLRSKGFLKDSDLQFYGVGPHWYRRHIGSKQALLDAIAKSYGVETEKRGTSRHLRSALRDAGRPALRCEVTDCGFDDEFGLDIHHIIPRIASRSRSIEVHDAQNLIALCPNHHRIAGTFDWDLCARRPASEWRAQMLAFLARPNPC